MLDGLIRHLTLAGAAKLKKTLASILTAAPELNMVITLSSFLSFPPSHSFTIYVSEP